MFTDVWQTIGLTKPKGAMYTLAKVVCVSGMKNGPILVIVS